MNSSTRHKASTRTSGNTPFWAILTLVALIAPFLTAHSQECITPEAIEEINRGVAIGGRHHIEGNLARVFIALDPVWSFPDFDDVPYRHPTDMQRARDEFERLMQEGIDEIVVWRMRRRTLGAAIPFSAGCAVEGYGEPDDMEKLEAMLHAVRQISNRGIDHPSVRREIRKILEPVLETYGLPSLTSEDSYEEKVDIVIDKIRPLLSVTEAADRGMAGGDTGPLAIAGYEAVIVGEFTDGATENVQFRGDTPQEINEAREAYEADLTKVRRNLRELLIQELRRTNVFSEVAPGGAATVRRALLIEGEVTQFDRGNLATRYLVGLGAGRVRFDTIIRIKDAATGSEISKMEMGRGSGILGGATGLIITVEYYMHQSAMKIASQLRDERCAVIVCEEPPPLTVIASEEADRAGKEFDAKTEECRVYFYISLPGRTGNQTGVEVWLDDIDAGVMDSEDGYFLWSLEAGDHQVFTRYLSANLRRSIEIECGRGDTVFVHHEVQGPMIERLLLEPENEGQRDVRRRHLLLTPLSN